MQWATNGVKQTNASVKKQYKTYIERPAWNILFRSKVKELIDFINTICRENVRLLNIKST